MTIVLGIEYLGNFSDEKDFTEFKQSEVRFKNGLDYFKDTWYLNNKELLFRDLRWPLIHQYRPGDKIRLTSNCKQNAPLTDHLKLDDSQNRILVLEKFFDDFKQAVKRFKNKIKSINSLNKEKLEAKYCSVSQVTSPTNNEVYWCTGSTQNISVAKTK